MTTTQQQKVDEAIEITLGLLCTNCKADEALKFSQTALNLASRGGGAKKTRSPA